MTKDQRRSLLSVTNPRAAKHHHWEIKLDWGKLNLTPDGSVYSIEIDNPSSYPLELAEYLDNQLIEHAKNRIKRFSEGKTLIENTLKQIES